MCKGTNPSGFFVACEAEADCPFGGWLHPECTADLHNISKEHIDNLDKWYCQVCRQRIQQEDEEEQLLGESERPFDDEEEDSGSVKELEAQIEADRLEAEQIQRDIDQQNLNEANGQFHAESNDVDVEMASASSQENCCGSDDEM